MLNRILNLMARTQFQPLWRGLYRVAIGGLGYMNADPRLNGEERFLAAWARRWAADNAGRRPVVFDVGANEGDFTAAMLEACDDCEVHCFEPNPKTFARLSARFASDSRVKLNNMGMGDKPGSFTLYDYAGSEGSGHASFLPATFDDVYKSATQTTQAKICTLDGYLAERSIGAVDFLKVDVEGLEKAVLEGAAASLAARRIGTIQMEFNAHNILTGLSILALSKMLPGYDLHRIVANGLAPMLDARHRYNSRLEIFKYANVVAMRSDATPAG